MRAIAQTVMVAALCCGPTFARAEFVEVASQTDDGIVLDAVDPEIDADISEAGVVVFVGGSAADRLYVGSADTPPVLTEIDLTSFGLTDASAAHVQADFIVFNAAHPDAGPTVRGIYALPVGGGPLAVLLEGCTEMCDDDEVLGPQPFYARSLAISVNGTVAFSTVRSQSGVGAIYRGPVDGAVSALQPDSSDGGFLFNTQGVDVNDAGRVAVQTEYFDPSTGNQLRRGIFVFASADEDFPEVNTVLHGLNVASQPQPSFFGANQVGYAFGDALYRGTPVAYGDHPDGAPVAPVLLADTSAGFAAFERRSGGSPFVLRSSEAGPFAFEARLDDDRHGVFRGPDPESDAVLVEGDALLGGIAREIYLGDINGCGQIVLRVVIERPDGFDTVIVRVDEDEPPPTKPKPWWFKLLKLLLAKLHLLFH